MLGAPDEKYLDRLFIFNTPRGKLISTDACAFIRHAVNCFYRDFAMVDTHDRAFVWERTFEDAMRSYRNAVLAWAQSIRVFTAIRRYTNQKKQVDSRTFKMYGESLDSTGSMSGCHTNLLTGCTTDNGRAAGRISNTREYDRLGTQ